MGDLVLLHISTPIATVTLNRAERHNSLIPGLLEEILSALGIIQAEEKVRAVVLLANGRSFSTGGDLRGFYDHLDEIESYASQIVRTLNQVILKMLNLRVPIVTAAHGMVTGGSLGLLLASDIVLVSPNASIATYYSVVGFSPDGGWTALLPFIIGPKRVADILIRNQTITAEEAVAWGLASRIVPAGDIHQEAQEIAMEIAASPSGSLYLKNQLLSAAYGDVAARLEMERVHFVEQISRPETQKSMIAFLNSM